MKEKTATFKGEGGSFLIQTLYKFMHACNYLITMYFCLEAEEHCI